MLVNLLKLPPLEPLLDELNQSGIKVRRAHPFEITPVRNFIKENFSISWADEISVGFVNKPVSVHIATRDGQVIGFAAHECTRRAFFGPTGVAESERGRSVGKALLIASLWGLRELGYAYGVIGRAGPVEFYKDAVGAIVIPESDPGIYADLLK
jgi:predicted N-acetyltransferase YhbS